MTRKDFLSGLIIGSGVGLLIQPILANNLPAKDLAFLTLPIRAGIFLFFLVLAPFALWIANSISRRWRDLRFVGGLYQFAQFAAVGTLNSFIYDGVFNIETFLYGSTILSNWRFALFIAIAFLFSTTNSFLWNKYWTFGAGEKPNAKEISGFYGVTLVGLILNVGFATFIKSIGPVDSKTWVNIVSPLAGILISFAWNFIGYKYWVFKDRKQNSPNMIK